MRSRLATLHGDECDLLVLGGTVFAAAVAWQAAAAGVRTVLASEGDLAAASAVRGRTWLERAPILDPRSNRADFDGELLERENLLRAAAPFVRPAAVAVTLPDGKSARALLQQLRRAPRSTLPPPALAHGGDGRRVEAFDGVVDEPALARAMAAAAVARGARVVVHAACAGVAAAAVELRSRRDSEGARLRAKHILLAMDADPSTVTTALQAQPGGEWTAAADVRCTAPHADGGPAHVVASASGLAIAVPGHAHRHCRWLPRAPGVASADAEVDAGFAALGLLDGSPPRSVRSALPTRVAQASLACGALHEWPWRPAAAHAAAAAFVAARLGAAPLPVRALGGAPAEPSDRLWRQYGWRAALVRRHCAVDAAANELLCPHRPTQRGEVAFAMLEDGAIGFDDVLRRLNDDGLPCLLPECVAAAHAAYLRVVGRGEADDLAHAMAAFRAAP